MVNANTGYLPFTIFNNNDYSYAYCITGEPCKYLNNQTAGTKIISSSNNNLSSILYIIGGILMAVLISVGIISLFLKWLKY